MTLKFYLKNKLTMNSPFYKKGNVILTSKQAKAIDEDNHEFDNKPAESDIKKAAFINAKMKKMKKQRQGRKAIKDINKVTKSIKN